MAVYYVKEFEIYVVEKDAAKIVEICKKLDADVYVRNYLKKILHTEYRPISIIMAKPDYDVFLKYLTKDYEGRAFVKD